MSARTAAALVPPSARAMRWGAFLGAAAAGLATVGIPAALDVTLAAENLTGLLRVATVGMAVGVAFLLDDPAAPSTTAMPTGRLVRHAVRAGLAIAAVTAWWTAAVLVTVGGAAPDAAGALPLRGLTLEAAALCVTGLAVAALAARHGRTGTAAAPALLVLAVAAHLLPTPAALYVAPDDPRWDAAHDRWTLLLATAAVIAVWATRESRRRHVT